MKRIVISFFVLVAVFVLGFLAAFWLRRLHTGWLELSPDMVTIEKIAGRESLVIDYQPDDFSPTGFDFLYRSFFDVTFDYNDNHIDIRNMAVLKNLFSWHDEHQQPLIICGGLCSGLLPYEVRYWDGGKFVVLGKLRVEQVGNGNKLTWHPNDQINQRPSPPANGTPRN